MALLTPSSLSHIVNISIVSRLILFAIQFASNNLIADHQADAYRNKYYQLLSNNGSNSESGSSVKVLSDVNWYFYNAIEGFTKWDAQYFLEISNDGYTSEKHLAFLPLYPLSISLVRQLLFERSRLNFDHLLLGTKLALPDQEVPVIALENYIRSAVVGFALNNFVFFPLACVFLFVLTKMVQGRDEKYAKNVVWWFCFNPASIFFSACYTESLFAALTFLAMFVIEYNSEKYLRKHKDENQRLKKAPPPISQKDFEDPMDHLTRLLHICSLPCLAILALTSATRSNGLVTIGFLGYQLLLKYAPTQVGRIWSTFYFSLMLFLDILVIIVSSILAASGYITFQIYSYIRFCIQENSNQKGKLNIKSEWCESIIPHPYGHVQAKYWNVGPFNYYEAKQLPNFLLALPITYLVLAGSLKKSKHVTREREGKKQLVYYIHGILLTLFCGISINVQVTTRLLASSCPVVYWICADLAEQSRFRSRILVAYFIFYFTLGTVLHANFYPWT